MKVANDQIRSTTLSANRQAWINYVRSQLAEFLAKAIELDVARSGNVLETEHFLSGVQELRLLEMRLVLAMNPTEEEHTRFSADLNDVVASLGVFPVRPGLREEFVRLHSGIRSRGQRMLKAEWERVKRLD